MLSQISRLTELLYRTKAGTRDELMDIAGAMLGRGGGAIYTVNPLIRMGALRDGALFDVLLGGVCIPDGVGVARALCALDIPTETLPGVELGEALLSRGVKFAIIGGVAGRAERAGEALVLRHPTCECVLARDGYFDDERAVQDEILECAPEVVLVCLGSPKQEMFISRLLKRGSNSLCIALGGSVDVYSGAKRRCPKALRALSLEWGWRMLCEPRRIFRLPTLLKFVRISRGAVRILRKSEPIFRK